jgi:hypothetical protein
MTLHLDLVPQGNITTEYSSYNTHVMKQQPENKYLIFSTPYFLLTSQHGQVLQATAIFTEQPAIVLI